jgi:MFS family permease
MILDAARGRAADFRAVFRIAPFRIYQTGAILMTLGFWMQRVAVGWLIWRMTGSEAWLGLVAFAELFPAILTGLAGGGIADRSSAPVVLFWGNLALVGVSATLLALSLAGGLTPGMVLVLMVLVGGISGLILPARLSMATFLVPVTLLPTALAVNSTGFNLSRFIGPALAAGILAFGPADWVFGFSMLGYGALSLALFRIRNATPQAGRPARAVGDNGSGLGGDPQAADHAGGFRGDRAAICHRRSDPPGDGAVSRLCRDRV